MTDAELRYEVRWRTELIRLLKDLLWETAGSDRYATLEDEAYDLLAKWMRDHPAPPAPPAAPAPPLTTPPA